MIARFFIDRPVFAWVIAIVIMLAGIASIRMLPVEQYPDVAPPQVSIKATYTGADAQTVENSVTQIIEQQLTGIDGLMYFSSSSSSSGSASINITFEQGTDPDTAQVQVQNKVQQALSRLPTEVQSEGVTVTKGQSDFLMVASFYDSTDKATSTDVSDYLVSNLQDPIARVDGVGDVKVFGSQYAMRIWMDPAKLASYQLMPSDIETALEAQNVQIAAGSIGGMPISDDKELNATVTAQSMYSTPEQFENIILKHSSSGATVRLKDVARVELGSESYSSISRLNGHPAAGIAVMLASGANALDTSEAVRSKISELLPTLPKGYKVAYPRDSTDFVRLSIEEVVKTLVIAIVLVVLVMFAFLQNFRATLIPTIAVPVVLLGTFGILNLFGYTINTLTMFGMVLAIGLLVDDAIVVVENVERVMHEQMLKPRQATIHSMTEISSALIGIVVVLSAVFLPMAFFGGSTGVIYRQFSVTIISAMVLSVVVALTLTPALCATILKAKDEHAKTPWFAGWFNGRLEALVNRYKHGVDHVIHSPLRWIAVYGVIVIALCMLFGRLPTSFLPQEDQGQVMVMYTLPQGASVNRTLKVAEQVENYFMTKEKNAMKAMFSVSGFNFSGSGQNAGMAFMSLVDWSERDKQHTADAISQRAMGALSSVRDAQIITMNPPAIHGLGQSNGFSMELLADSGTSRETLTALGNQLIREANADPDLTGVRASEMAGSPQLKVDIDQNKATSLGLSLSDVSSTLTAAWAGVYVNDFIDRGRVKKVYIEGDEDSRSSPNDLGKWYVRGTDDDGDSEMTPFSAFATTHWDYAAQSLARYNGVASFGIQGSAAQGISSGVAMDRMEALAAKLKGVKVDWTDMSYQEKQSSGQAMTLYSISVLIVFLSLAALYESWTIPIAVLLVIPLGVIGAVIAAMARGLSNDVFFQVALLTTIGLAARNSILIVEFAATQHALGKGLIASAIEAARLRLRPILMTSVAFLAGLIPLALSTGAGANSRIEIGTSIIGGTITATTLAIFMVPMFYVLVCRLLRGERNDESGEQSA